MTTAMERFLTVLLTGPSLKADAIVVLCGEDATPRLDVAAQLFFQGAAPYLVLSGGRHQPPRWTGAASAREYLLAKGIADDRIAVEGESRHTQQQALAVTRMATDRGWTRCYLVASAYHLPRAFLTFVRALADAGQSDRLQLIPFPTSHAPWSLAPEGMRTTRLRLLDGEWAKLTDYADHVATPEDGLAYLLSWERSAC